MLMATCPFCQATGSQGNNYPKLLAQAVNGKLKFLCHKCDSEWKPTAAERQQFAVKLRRLITLK
jgi:hypothetical protein